MLEFHPRGCRIDDLERPDTLVFDLDPGPDLAWRAIAEAASRAHVYDAPKNLTTNMSKDKRKGKVFIDYLRNGRGSTCIARYSTRAREGATIATPLRWDELSFTAPANRYTINNIRRRLSALKADPWENYEEARSRITRPTLKQFNLEWAP